MGKGHFCPWTAASHNVGICLEQIIKKKKLNWTAILEPIKTKNTTFNSEQETTRKSCTHRGMDVDKGDVISSFLSETVVA